MLSHSKIIQDLSAKQLCVLLRESLWMHRVTALTCLAVVLSCGASCKKGKKKSGAAVTDPAVVVKVSPAVVKNFIFPKEIR